MPRPRRKRRVKARWRRRVALAILAVPGAYLAAALVGSLVPVNSDWEEPDDGVTVYLASNGIHADIVMPIQAAGLDWGDVVDHSTTAAAPADPRWIAFGSGEEKVYLDTPRWQDITPATIWSALTGGTRVMHVEWVDNPDYADRAIRLRPHEYRRLWAAIRADFDLAGNGEPKVIDARGYGCCDAFYRATGRFTALRTCNSWAAGRLRLAGIETSLWPPFVQGLTWRYRRIDQST